MKRISTGGLLSIVIAAFAINACSDDSAPNLSSPVTSSRGVSEAGAFNTVDFPGARRQVVGGYFDASRVLHAYVMQLSN